MKPSTISMLAAIAATFVIALSTAAYASVNGGKEATPISSADAPELWASNGCAVGGSPPPGANCSNRR
jgi:hypothetical protein